MYSSNQRKSMNSDKEIDRRNEGHTEWYDRIDVGEYERLAALGYTPRQLAKYYNVPFREFERLFDLPGSRLKYHYERGVLVQQAKEGIVMTEAAAEGANAVQAQRLDKLRHQVEVRNAVACVFWEGVDV